MTWEHSEYIQGYGQWERRVGHLVLRIQDAGIVDDHSWFNWTVRVQYSRAASADLHIDDTAGGARTLQTAKRDAVRAAQSLLEAMASDLGWTSMSRETRKERADRRPALEVAMDRAAKLVEDAYREVQKARRARRRRRA